MHGESSAPTVVPIPAIHGSRSSPIDAATPGHNRFTVTAVPILSPISEDPIPESKLAQSPSQVANGLINAINTALLPVAHTPLLIENISPTAIHPLLLPPSPITDAVSPPPTPAVCTPSNVPVTSNRNALQNMPFSFSLDLSNNEKPVLDLSTSNISPKSLKSSSLKLKTHLKEPYSLGASEPLEKTPTDPNGNSLTEDNNYYLGCPAEEFLSNSYYRSESRSPTPLTPDGCTPCNSRSHTPASRRSSSDKCSRGWLYRSRNLPFFSSSIASNDDETEERGLPVPQATIRGPSAYIPQDELPSLGTFNEQTHMLFIDAFLQNNRLDHVTQVMGYHPTYLDTFLRTQNFILRGDGPLPYDYRHFIAIMAAGRHQCSYLINLQKQEFLLQGGDQTWLKGLSKIPQKLRDLYEINKILAHRPWLINKTHIEKLTKGKDSWSLAEVVHAIVLLAHFHSLASFVFGCGVNEELDQEGGHLPGGVVPTLSSSPRSIPTPVRDREVPWGNASPVPASPVEQEVGVDQLMLRMKNLSERSEEFTQEEKTKRFEHVENQSVELSPGLEPLTQLKADIGQFVDDPTFLYQDFARRGEVSDIPTFRVQDYSWDDHGYSLVNRLYNDVGNLLDEKFKTAYNLTYYTMGGRKDVDTSRFRRAIWNYIQCMFGIRHDDYDYGEVNQLLERSLKAFIKSACCYPERVTKKDYDRVLREFKHSEKVHVNLMVLEARMQAELLYALRAVMRYMT